MFEIRITSLHEFLVFVKVIRGQDMTDDELQKVIQTITTDTNKLEEAVKSQQS